MRNLINLQEYKMEKQYIHNQTTCVNLALDNIRKEKRNIEREMIKGYLALLSNK